MTRQPDCLSDEDVSLIVTARPEETGRLLQHAASCDWCGERLRVFLSVGEGNTTVEEEVLLKRVLERSPAHNFASASKDFPAEPLRPARSRIRRVWFLRPSWAAAFAAIVVIVSGATAWLHYSRPERRIDGLLAQAYTAHREFDWRLPDAGWSRRNLQRGPEPGRPLPLLEAETLLAGNDTLNSPVMLDLKVRADLLEFKMDDAIAILQEAISLDGQSLDLLTDLAVAYALRAERDNSTADYGAVVEYTTRVLNKDPRNNLARYNLALAYERLSMIEQAAAEWQTFIQNESDQQWIKEAKDRLAHLQEVLQRRGALIKSSDETDQSLEAAAITWLARDRGKARSVGKALAEKYHDAWLRDASAEPVDSSALNRVLEANAAGELKTVLQQVHAAVVAYKSFPAHLARARLEETYAFFRTIDAPSCLRTAASLRADLSRSNYHWISTMAELYESSCKGMSGDSGGSTAGYQATLDEARRYGLRGLELRSLVSIASSRIRAGDPMSAWEPSRLAMALLYDSPYQLVFIQQCLSNFSFSGEALGWYAASTKFTEASADILASIGIRSGEAANRSRSASMALMAGLTGDAQTNAAAAARLFSTLPDSVARGRYLASVQVLQARALVQAGKPADALSALPPDQDGILSAPDLFQSHLVAGAATLKLGHEREAQQHLEAAIRLVESRSSSEKIAADRALSRREGQEAFRNLAVLLIREGRAPEALNVWLAAFGSEIPPTMVFLALDDGYGVWNQGRFTHVAISRREVQNRILRITAAASNPKSDIEAIRRDGRWLFQNVILPVAPDFGSQANVSVLPDAELASLPFQLLVNSDNRWLAERCTVIFSPAPMTAWNAIQRGLIVGNPTSVYAPAPIPEFVAEAESARAAFKESVTLTGSDATAHGIEKLIPTAGAIHFTGHGYAYSGGGELYLANDQWTAESVRRLPLRQCRLVVLASCLTAVGENSGLGNSNSIVRSFLDAGAKTVIASRWEVDSDAAAVLMDQFYKALRANQNAAQALLIATSALRSKNQFAHPYFWSEFQMYE